MASHLVKGGGVPSVPLLEGSDKGALNSAIFTEFYSTPKIGFLRPTGPFYLAPKYAIDGVYSDVAQLSAGSVLDGGDQTLSIDPVGYGDQVGTTDLYHAIALASGSEAHSFTLDGLRASVVTSLTSMGFRGLQFELGATFVNVHDVTIQNIPAVAGIESFGINTSPGSADGDFSNLTISNVDGTGLHFRGDYNADSAFGGKAFRHSVDTATLNGNTWHGISVFGAFDCTAYDLICNNNTQCGVNVEYGGCDFDGLTASGNGQSGFCVMGDSEGSLNNATLSGNNTSANTAHAEIVIQSNEWIIGAVPQRKQPTQFEFGENITITPLSGKPHVRSRASNLVTAGSPAPSGIVFRGTNWRTRTFAYEDVAGSRANDRFGPGMSFPDLLAIGTELAAGTGAGQLPALSAWRGGGGTSTWTPYADADPNTPAGAHKFVADAQFRNRNTGTSVFAADTDYLIYIKWKPLDDLDEYVINSNPQYQTLRMRLGQKGVDLNRWFDGYFIFHNVSATTSLQFAYNGATEAVSASGMILGQVRIWKLP